MGTPTDDELRERFAGKAADPVITEIRFPRYKALAPNLTITFTFPITALVGPNGSNKSSILHALYGAPSGKSLSDFWFSTAVDDIDSRTRANESTLQRFIYKFRTHVKDRSIIGECRKARGKKPYRQVEVPKALATKKDPDYWESTKRVAVDHMADIPVDDPEVAHLLSDTKVRWNPVPKDVEYLDFRSELSAYDKYLYHAAEDQWTKMANGKKFRVLDRAEGLARAFEQRARAKDNERILEPVRHLSDSVVSDISHILGKKFASIKIVKHKFYSSTGYSAKLRLADGEYSEAHAGSGEFAIVRLVDAISEMDNNGLLLLDEPEVSLHPGAQKRLVNFLKRQVVRKGTQVVLSTHSPSIVEELPAEAIKLLSADPETGEVSLISDETHPSQAFFHIGHTTGLKNKRIMVEDALAAEIVSRAITVHCDDLRGIIAPVIFPGGAGNLVTHSLPALALAKATDVVMLLDGDQRTDSADWTECDRIPATAQNRELWQELAKKLLGCVPKHFANTKGQEVDDESVVKNLRDILLWGRDNIYYLDGKVPEAAVLAETEDWDPESKTRESKARFVEIARETFGHSASARVSSTDILSAQRIRLSKLDESSPLIKSAYAAIDAVR
ncbi:ATP-binding protein [Rhodococcus sp. AG1013]|uniref:ATP-binding protein n=1 Tax=unclassified Rhodococcus (in: high G+C Gram-positive bacteria) TaxID=192944 RepID=UPI000E2C3DEF|nr:ATP-binding protein [Rhodococcus sp. AG1013]RDI24041.1 putative ATP-dependent endonuclease of OLD family [Rhodococcus sp. AG1013]